MTTTVGEWAFVDTSVLLHSTLVDSPWHDVCEHSLQREYAVASQLCISSQIVREMLVRITHPLTLNRPVTYTSAEAVDMMEPIIASFAMIESAPVASLFSLVRQFDVTGKQIHDCFIVASMVEAKVRRLLTRNAADFRRFEPLIEIVPVS
jgi:predicted nucleic acid-binding protein